MYTQREMVPGEMFTYRYVGETSDSFVQHYGFVSASPVIFAVPDPPDPFATSRALPPVARIKAVEFGCLPSGPTSAAVAMTLRITDGIPSDLFMRCVRLSRLHEGDAPAIDVLARTPPQYAEPYSLRNELESLEWLQHVVRAALHAVEAADGRERLSALEREAETSPSSVARQLYRLRSMYYRNLENCSEFLRLELQRMAQHDERGSALQQHEWNNAAARKREREQTKRLRVQTLMVAASRRVPSSSLSDTPAHHAAHSGWHSPEHHDEGVANEW
jgi:hypothetical protein